MRACKEMGCRVLLLTREKLRDEPWPWESIDEVFYMPDLITQPNLTYAVSYLARERPIARIVPLDDYDVEVAAALREHLRIPGMGDTTVRYFRDKLAMRVQARENQIPVPDFVPVLNYDQIRDFMLRTPAPWVLKPRSEAGAVGIKKIEQAEDLWRALDFLGDRQSYYVLEKFLPGDVYHVDSIVSEREVLFANAHKYGMPPMTVYQGGGVFMSRTLPYGEEEESALQEINRRLIQAMGMVRGVTHAEFIRAHADGQFYFLEIAARVGGANIDLMVEHESGINLWAEWARIEICHLRGEAYTLPPVRQEYAGLILCLARQEWPDSSGYTDAEIVWRLQKKNHVGMILHSSHQPQVEQLLGDYARRFADDFLAVAPPRDKPDD